MIRNPAGPAKLVRDIRARASAWLCGLLALVCVNAHAHAQPVKAEAVISANGGYARLVIKFEQDVPTEAVVAGAILIVRFKNPVDINIDKLAESAPNYIGSVRRDPDGTAIRMSLAQKVNFNLMAAGERIFIDLLPEGWAGQPPALPAEVVRELSNRAIAAERALRLQKVAEDAKKRPPVRVRASVQPTFTRFVFEMPEGVAVSSSLNSDKFMLSFAAPLTFDLADAKIAMPANIKSIEQNIDGEATSVGISLIGEVDVRAFREDRNYVVDVGFEQSQKPVAQAIATQPARIVQTAATESSASKPKVAEETPPAKQDVVTAPDQNNAAVKPPVETTPTTAPVPSAPVLAEAPKTSLPTLEPIKTPAPEKMAAAVAPEPTPQPASPPAKTDNRNGANAGIVVEAKRSSDDLRAIFPIGAPVKAAAFRRSDSIWLVLDTDQPIDAQAIQREGGSIVSDVSVLDLAKGKAVRIRLTRPQLAALAGDERGWTLTMADKVQAPSQPLVAARNIADPARASVSIALPQPGALHRIDDPDSGNALMVVTAPAPARGFMKRQNFVEFALVESIHGIVVQPNADDLTIELATDKAVIGRPGGLTLSAAMMTPERAATVVKAIFDVAEWRDNQKADFIATRNRLQTAAAVAPADQRMAAHLALSRFYMARGFYAEAKGVLDLVIPEIKQGEDDPAPFVVHAVASTLSGRPEIALKDLASPAIGVNFDSQIWKALAFARQEKWADAREKFKNVEFAITTLPLDLQRIVILEAFRASLQVKDYAGATARSNDLDVVGVAPQDEGEAALLRGRLAEALGREKDALSDFQKATLASDRPAAAEARLLSIALRQKRNEIDEDDALRDLETAAVTWRGDSIELRNLQMLSRLYAAKGRYGEAFVAARNATRLQPNSEISRKMQDEATALFEQVFNGPKGDELPPVEALAMFYEYRDLTPIGRRGDEMIRRLADRLVAVDLLDQASELLQYQVDHRLEGAARAQVAARLAMVYLMNRKPDRAVAALRATRIADLAGELRQQRLLLEARAQSDIGRHDLALDIISNIGGREAIRLRSDIYWAARRWRESSEQIELLYGNRWRDFQPLTVLEKSDVIRAAIGYAMAEDTLGLVRFREKYSPKMDGDGDRAPFDLASQPASANSADFARIAKMAATIDTLDGFLREMKTRFPDAMARSKLPPDIKTDPTPTGSLPPIVGLKGVKAARQ